MGLALMTLEHFSDYLACVHEYLSVLREYFAEFLAQGRDEEISQVDHENPSNQIQYGHEHMSAPLSRYSPPRGLPAPVRGS